MQRPEQQKGGLGAGGKTKGVCARGSHEAKLKAQVNEERAAPPPNPVVPAGLPPEFVEQWLKMEVEKRAAQEKAKELADLSSLTPAAVAILQAKSKQVEDLQAENAVLKTKVKKGPGKPRPMHWHMQPKVQELLLDYIHAHFPEKVLARSSNWERLFLFPSNENGNNFAHGPTTLTPKIKAVAERVLGGIKSRHVTAYSFRHSVMRALENHFASLENSGSARFKADCLLHQSRATQTSYARPSAQEAQCAWMSAKFFEFAPQVVQAQVVDRVEPVAGSLVLAPVGKPRGLPSFLKLRLYKKGDKKDEKKEEKKEETKSDSDSDGDKDIPIHPVDVRSVEALTNTMKKTRAGTALVKKNQKPESSESEEDDTD